MVIGGRLASAVAAYMLELTTEKLLPALSRFILTIERVRNFICFFKTCAAKSLLVGEFEDSDS